MAQYSAGSLSAANAEKTGEPSANIQTGDHISNSDANVTPQPSAAESVLNREERVEYRDQDGNLLDEKQIAELEGKVSFSTRYETRTRVVDADGNEIADGSAGAEGFAPPHPDVDREPETAADVPENDGRDFPATVSPDEDIGKEKSVNEANVGTPRPASEAKKATK